MHRPTVLFVLVSLALLACSDTTEGSTVPAETTSTSVAVTSTPAEATTPTDTPVASSTTAPPAATTTTETPAATTTTVAVRPVTEHPNLPSAQGGHLVDWDAVGPGWILALYDARDVTTMTAAPTVLYIVDPTGTRYEVASWPLGGPYAIADWAGAGDTALLLRGGQRAAIVDLRSGDETAAVSLPLDPYGTPVSFTSPTGTNIVILTDDGTTQRIERRTRSGSVLSVIWEQEAPTNARNGLEWLYGYDGTFVVVKQIQGMELVKNDGTFLTSLWSPLARSCTPVRWWTADSFLAACLGEGPAFPHDWYSQLWVLNIDGTAGDMLTAFPPGPVPVVDMGYHDAWRLPTRTVAQWIGDCGAAGVHEVASDGSTTPIGATSSHRFIEVDASGMTILGWQACDSSEGWLYLSDPTGNETNVLVPRVGDSWGVRDAAGLATVYP